MPSVPYVNLNSSDLADPTLSSVNLVNRTHADEINRLGGLNGPVLIVAPMTVQGGVTCTSINLGNVTITTGMGSPEGKVRALPGSLYLNQNGGTGKTLWVKEGSGNNSVGWAAK
jgi:hypothetical protein